MSFGIIIKGGSSKRFRPHFNRSIVDAKNPNGTMIHTKEQYMAELKAKNLVPYEKGDYKDKKEKKYKPSKWAHEMVNEIQRTDGNPKGAWYAQLEKKGISKKTLQSVKEHSKKIPASAKGGIKSD